MLNPEIWAEIRRLYHNEGYSKRVISRMLKVTRKTVYRALSKNEAYRVTKIQISKLVEYQKMILEILKKYPQLSAVRIYDEIKQKGYTGSISLLCEYLRKVRGSKKEAFLRIETLPTEQAQVDWANFGWIEIDGYKRRLSCFVMVLSYSRMMYIEFKISEKTEDFISCHINAFIYFGGIVKKILYDNLKSVVLVRYGKEIQFNARFLDFAGHYLFQPVICTPGQPHEKGRVEVGIKYVRNNFWAGREFKDLDDINKQAIEWLKNVANVRIHATTHQRPIDRFNDEKDKLNKIPEIKYDTSIIQPCQSNKDCRVKFDSNIYSVPHEYANHNILTLKASEKEVMIFADEKLIAKHTRSYLKYQVIENPKHYEGLLEKKKRAREYKIRDIFLKLTPKAKDYLEGLLQAKINITHQLNKILSLCSEYSQEEVKEALEYALTFGAFGYEYIKNIITQNRTRKHIPDESGEVSITKQKEWSDICVTPHDLSKYDEMQEEQNNGNNQDERKPEVS